MMNPPPLLHCSNIHKSFPLDDKSDTDLQVLKGVDLDVSDGEIVSIVGASGSGKSTLLHILGGLDRPTGGNVFWSGIDILAFPDEKLAKVRGTHVGFVFQFHHLLPEFSALENVMLPVMIHGGSTHQAVARGKELLRRMGLEERMDHKPGELSGGEQQRVAVARSLANAPKIVLADEPTGNLDSAASLQLQDLIWELNEKERQTFVIVTHNEALARRSHRILRMADGKLHPAVVADS